MGHSRVICRFALGSTPYHPLGSHVSVPLQTDMHDSEGLSTPWKFNRNSKDVLCKLRCYSSAELMSLVYAESCGGGKQRRVSSKLNAYLSLHFPPPQFHRSRTYPPLTLTRATYFQNRRHGLHMSCGESIPNSIADIEYDKYIVAVPYQ